MSDWPAANSLLARALREPALAGRLSAAELDLLVRQGRRADLLALLGERLAAAGHLQPLHPRARNHVESARRLAAKQARDVHHEVHCIMRVLEPLWVPVILLKGAAYLLAGLPAGTGRLVGDVDIMVPQPVIDDVEKRLLATGWTGFKTDPYDQRYFRVWMHEIPPLVHVDRGVTLDVHHTILPPTARMQPDAGKLLAAARPLDEDGLLHVLGDLDMVLHSATHLFQEGEFEHGLRDLFDLDSLLRHFAGSRQGFWDALTARAAEMDLAVPLAYALRYAHGICGTPVPAEVIDGAARAAGLTPGGLAVRDWLYGRALAAPHPSCDGHGGGLARWILYVRSHWLRMPLHLLVPHLLRKAVRRRLYEE